MARGEAHDVAGLSSVAERASADVRAAITRIRKVPLSAENRRQVLPFLAELDRVEPQLSAMTRTTAAGNVKRIGKLGLRLADATKRFQDRADAVGLRECADTRQNDAVRDAITAPVYAIQIARFEGWFIRALVPLESSPPPRSAAFARYIRRVSRVYDRAEKRLDDLYEYQPNRAVEAGRALGFALEGYESLLEDVADSLRGGTRILTPVGVKQFRRALAKRQRKVHRAIVKLSAAIGAEPVDVPDAETETA